MPHPSGQPGQRPLLRLWMPRPWRQQQQEQQEERRRAQQQQQELASRWVVLQ